MAKPDRNPVLTDEEQQVLVQAEALLYPIVRKHFDLFVVCWCPLCRAHSHLVKATMDVKAKELAARKHVAAHG